MSQLFGEKSILSKLMATENIAVEQKAVKTASFNLKTRVLTIPNFKEEVSAEILDVLFSHEISHALHTPHDEWTAAIKEHELPHSILNVVEDARIEKLIKKKYPGLRPSYVKGYNELIEKEFFGIDVKEGNLDKFNFLDKINIFYKIGHVRNFDYNFCEVKQSFIDEIAKLETFKQVVDLSKRLYEFLKEELEKNNEDSFSEFDLNDLSFDFDSDAENGGGQDSSQIPISVGSSGEYLGGDAEGQSSGKYSHKKQSQIESLIDKIFKENEEYLFSDEEVVYYDVPDIDPNEVIVDYKELITKFSEHFLSYSSRSFVEFPKTNFYNFRKSNSGVVNYLVKEFELKKNAIRLKKTRLGKSGDLCNKKLFSYKVSDDLFRRLNIVEDGKSHGLLFYIDWSGSMDCYINETIRQLLNLIMFCQKVNIPYEVYAFSSQYCDEQYKVVETFKQNHSTDDKIYLNIMDVKLLNIFSSRMTKSQFINMANLLLGYNGYIFAMENNVDDIYGSGEFIPYWFRLGNTPLNSAVLNAVNISNAFKAKNKLQIVNNVFLTDGESNASDFIDTRIDTREENWFESFSFFSKSRKIIRYEKYKQYLTVPRKICFGYREERFFETKCFLDLFKKCVNSNVVGFYIIPNKELKKVLNDINIPESKAEVLKSMFTKSGSIVVDSAGYDEYYMIKSSSLKIQSNDIEIDGSLTAKAIAKTFTKQLTRKFDNRVILKKFISLIS